MDMIGSCYIDLWMEMSLCTVNIAGARTSQITSTPSPANDTRGLFDTAFTQTDKDIPVASQTSAIENIKEGRCAIAEHMTLRFPLTTPLICNTLFSAVGVTAFDSPSFAALIAPAQLSHVDALPNHRAAQSHRTSRRDTLARRRS
jgi:hypothetical protein